MRIKGIVKYLLVLVGFPKMEDRELRRCPAGVITGLEEWIDKRRIAAVVIGDSHDIIFLDERKPCDREGFCRR